MALNRMLSTEDESKVNRSPQFISAAAPREILERIQRSLIAMECEPKVDDVGYKVKATIRTAKGEISIIVNVYALSESLRFVEMHRGKGDLLEYNRCGVWWASLGRRECVDVAVCVCDCGARARP
jgi:hypothetical protein